MPTGYTSIIEERDVSFEEFVWRCARAFGALIELRDDPLDAPIPDRFQPSEYYPRELEKAQKDIKRLAGMTSAERTKEGERLRDESLAYHDKWLAKEEATNARYAQMVEKVEAWTPPTPEHQELREFMLKQLSLSMNNTAYIERSLTQTRTKAPGEFFADTLSEARRREKYLQEEMQKEAERTESRNRWVAQLRESVPVPAK